MGGGRREVGVGVGWWGLVPCSASARATASTLTVSCQTYIVYVYQRVSVCIWVRGWFQCLLRGCVRIGRRVVRMKSGLVKGRTRIKIRVRLGLSRPNYL